MRWYLPANALNKSAGWNAFRDHVRDVFPSYRKKLLPICVMNDVLHNYGAKYNSVDGCFWVDFDNEKRYMLFVLKFGTLR